MKKIISELHETISYLSHVFLFYVFRIFPIKNNKIVFSNFAGKGYGDNPRFICDLLLEKNTYDIVWELSDVETNMPKGIRKVRSGSVRYIYEMVTAKVWIDNSRKNRYVRKRKKQYYMQTWHGPFSPKNIEAEAADKLPSEYIEGAVRDGKFVDAIVVDAAVQEIQFKKHFYLNSKVEYLRIGLPRFDFFVNNKTNNAIVEEARSKFGINADEYVVLYAPTFRDNNRIDAYCLDLKSLVSAFSKRFNKKCKVIIRLHPNVAKLDIGIEYSNQIINGSLFPDMQELSFLSDAVITDYSTSFFDFLLLDKPVFLFAPDIKQYTVERGIHAEYYDLPFPLSETNEELIEQILTYDKTSYNIKVAEYRKNNPIYDSGDAAEKCVEWVEKKIRS